MTASGRIWRVCGLAVVAGLHAAGGWALVPAMDAPARGNDDAPVLEAVLIDEPAPPAPEPEPPLATPEPPPEPEPQPPPPPEPPPPLPDPPPEPTPAITPDPEPPPPAPVSTPTPPKPKPPRLKPRPAPTPASAPTPAAAPAEPPPAPKVEEPRRDPAVISCRVPAYPSESRRLSETGTVTLSLLVGPDGDVLDKRVDASSGHERLDAAALEALAKCRFKPGGRDGRAEPGWAKLRYVWKLN